MSKTYGEAVVRTEFNPSANSTVDQIKQKSAELINLIRDEVYIKLAKLSGFEFNDDNFDAYNEHYTEISECLQSALEAERHIKKASMLAVFAATSKLLKNE